MECGRRNPIHVLRDHKEHSRKVQPAVLPGPSSTCEPLWDFCRTIGILLMSWVVGTGCNVLGNLLSLESIGQARSLADGLNLTASIYPLLQRNPSFFVLTANTLSRHAEHVVRCLLLTQLSLPMFCTITIAAHSAQPANVMYQHCCCCRDTRAQRCKTFVVHDHPTVSCDSWRSSPGSPGAALGAVPFAARLSCRRESSCSLYLARASSPLAALLSGIMLSAPLPFPAVLGCFTMLLRTTHSLNISTEHGSNRLS